MIAGADDGMQTDGEEGSSLAEYADEDLVELPTGSEQVTALEGAVGDFDQLPRTEEVSSSPTHGSGPPIQAAILNGLRDVLRSNALAAVQVGDGPRQFQDAGDGTSGELQALKGAVGSRTQ